MSYAFVFVDNSGGRQWSG